MVMIVPLELAVSLFLAYLLNDEKMKGRGLYRTMYFVPVVTTASVVGIIMIFILGVQDRSIIFWSHYIFCKTRLIFWETQSMRCYIGNHFALEGLRNIYDLLVGRTAGSFERCI